MTISDPKNEQEAIELLTSALSGFGALFVFYKIFDPTLPDWWNSIYGPPPTYYIEADELIRLAEKLLGDKEYIDSLTSCEKRGFAQAVPKQLEFVRKRLEQLKEFKRI